MKLYILLVILFGIIKGNAAEPLKIVRDGKVGFIDGMGNVVVPMKFEAATDFSEGLAGLRSEGSWIIMDHSGAILSTNNATFLEAFHEGLAPAQLNGKWGFIDSVGVWQVRPYFNRVRPFSEGFGCGELTNGWYFINRHGKLLKGPFQATYPFVQGLAIVVTSNQWGIIDQQFNFQIKPEYDEISSFSNNSWMRLNKNGKWGIRDARGSIVLPFDFEWIGEINEGKAAVRKNEKWNWVQLDKTPLSKFEFEFAGRFSEGMAVFGRNGTFGYINANGDISIPNDYDEAQHFSSSRAWVRKGNRWAAINHNGEIVIPWRVALSVSPFQGGVAFVGDLASLKKGEYYVVSLTGKKVWPVD